MTATVALPNSSGAPAGPVTATIESVTGAVFTATLSPNPGGNTATANIVVNAPPPNAKGYTVEVSCQGNTNFQCQSPVDLTMTTVLGNTLTTMNVSPSAPQAGQPVTLTATINNSGNAPERIPSPETSLSTTTACRLRRLLWPLTRPR